MSAELIWLDPDVLSWSRAVGTWSAKHQGKEQRSYQHWNHAERLLTSDLDEFRRIDLLGALKRAVDFRVLLLNDVWDLGSIPHPDLPRNPFERLRFLGVIRPRMVERLMALRNAIEHEDATPPADDACADWVDFVWYFLRSTDSLIQKTADQWTLAPPDAPEDWRGTLCSGPELQWTFALSLRLEPSLVSHTQRADWITVRKRSEPFSFWGDDPKLRPLIWASMPKPVNDIDPVLGHFHLYGNIVGPREHIRTAAQVVLTPF